MNKIKTEADLNLLASAGTLEDRHLEYKSALYSADKSAKGKDPRNELAKDVSAFANADGGQILIGVDEGEKNAGPKIVGLDCNVDQEIVRMEQIMRSNIAPSIPGMPPVFAIPLTGGKSGKHVLVIDIPSSIRKPHQVAASGIFYVRQGPGVQRLNVDELRPMFIGAETLAARIEAFRHERVDLLLAGENGINLGERGAVILHVLPLSHWPAKHLDLREVTNPPMNAKFAFCLGKHADISRPWLPQDSSPRHWFQRIEYRLEKKQLLYFHQFVFADGAVEFIVRDIFVGGARRVLPGDSEGWREYKHVRLHCEKILRDFAELEISPPFCIMVSLLGTSDSVLVCECPRVPGPDTDESCHRCQEDRLLLPPFSLEEPEISKEDDPFIRWLDDIANAYHWQKWSGTNEE